ncbi:hypothetical protein BVRB_3g054100 [Beta vulgaris subsp. vulgaris]|nr:UPF0481 protein At3g47200 isoform X2 [Beta vulgaris subsp. vulgaris]KMT16256.1 hypothetical protein BVRB_3g054100 [Beta vulgaris subsp. vulgaris]
MEADDTEKQESGDQIALEITPLGPAEDLTSSIREKLEAISFPCCIFHVPNNFSSQGEHAHYYPKIISIGPFHHGKIHLLHMENHKWDYLNALLSRNFTLDSTLDSCVKVLKELEPKIRACYQGNLSFESDEFVRMILLDACFIIELFLRYTIRGLRRRDDALFRSPEKFHVLRNDLSLLENQIPFFVLQRIFSVVPLPRECDGSLSELSLRFFKPLIPTNVQLLLEKYSFEGSSHLLDLIWKAHLPSFSKVPMGRGNDSGKHLHSATKLRKVGIKVKAAEAESILDVKFIKGVLIIPSLKIHNYMEALFRNFIAMEHCHAGKMKHITSYVYLMKGLIHSQDDVKLFFRREIFISYVGEKGDLVDLFRNLCRNIDLDKFYYEGMWEQLMATGRTRWEVLYYKMQQKFREIQCKVSRVTLGVLVLVSVLIGILVIVLYFFISRHH